MKKCYFFSAVIALTFAGCTQEPFSREDGTEITIEAIMADNPASRTVIQEGTTSVLWEAGDEINVFYDGTGNRFANLYTDPSGTAKFSGTLNVVFASNEGFSDSTPLWGLYPYRADATADNTSVTTTLPASQTGRAGSFAKGTNITLGKSSSLTMGFYNVCGGVRFSLTTEGVKEVVFQGQNDEDIAGKVKLAFVDGLPAVQEIIDGQKSITLSAPYGTTFETGKWYYIAALPGTLSNGFKMTFNTETQYATLKSSGSKTIKRGTFGSLADADEDLVYKDKEGGEPVTGNIVFKDPAAKYACVAKYDTDGDGEVSIEEAEAATSFSGLFNNWKGVTSFDEIRYFKNVHSLNGVFNDCNKLVSITVPESITDLGYNAFNGCSLLSSVVLSSEITTIGVCTFANCSSLSSIEIPLSVTSVGSNAFSGCSSLTAIELPSGLTSIDSYAFQNCTSLASVDIPSNVISIGQGAFRGCISLGSIDLPPLLKTIGQEAFSNCSSLMQVVIPDGVTTLGSYAFSGCTKLSTANIPSGVSSIPEYCFQNCSSLTSVTIPAGVTSIGNKALSGVKMWKLELPSSITSLGSACFGSITCIILPSSTPVSIQSDTFEGVWGIFVPSNLIGMYGAMTNWSDYASRIHPLDSYKNKNEFTLATSGAVDMGTSVKWAAYNLGATKPEEYGDYYAWGETQTKSNYNWSTYKWCNGDYNKQTKYCPADKADYWDGEGTPDGKTVLDLEDDAAHVNLGGAWRMPTDEEWTELRVNCLWEWTVYEGINGYMVYGFDSGNSMFLPAAGGRGSTNLFDAGSRGGYWSSSLNADYPYFACYVNFNSGSVNRDDSIRFYGQSVRPVTE